ncbi:hypothetical protein HXX01_04995 [Candidatus Nomurabacteria bacterium]|nr:hypothetical protein [Candidatus Nomurabacteria bacterium]
MNLKKIAIVLNGFVHDFASGIWLAAIATIGMLHSAHLHEPVLTTALNHLERQFFWWSVVAMVVIMATGAGRTFTYMDNWYGADAERLRRRMLIIKHVVLFVIFGIGYLWAVGRVFH